jgi:AcrR family transcriptional regulator
MVEPERQATILDAALSAFSTYGAAKTTMADIAEAAGVSRPALYQYFNDKEDILVAVLVRVMGNAADNAIAELTAPGPLERQLDGFLQRWFGDLVAQLRTTAHGIDLVEIKTGRAKPATERINQQVRTAVSRHMKAAGVPQLVDVLLLSPAGLKSDDPSTAVYRRRLSDLAGALAFSAEADVAN